jgi:ABC-type Fe3+-siderophore transport system permease subunit
MLTYTLARAYNAVRILALIAISIYTAASYMLVGEV